MKPIHWAAAFAAPLIVIILGFVVVQRAYAPQATAPTASTIPSTPSEKPAHAVAVSSTSTDQQAPLTEDPDPIVYRPPFTCLSVDAMLNDFKPLVVSQREVATDDGYPHRIYQMAAPRGQILLIGPADNLRDVSYSVLLPSGVKQAIKVPIGALILAARAASPEWKDSATWMGNSLIQVMKNVDRPISVEENPHFETGVLRYALIGIPTRQGLMLTLTIGRHDDPRP